MFEGSGVPRAEDIGEFRQKWHIALREISGVRSLRKKWEKGQY
jgi:hypothetical protein